MTTSDCFVTLVGLKSHTDAANPAPFREALPPSMHYWAPAVERQIGRASCRERV